MHRIHHRTASEVCDDAGLIVRMVQVVVDFVEAGHFTLDAGTDPSKPVLETIGECRTKIGRTKKKAFTESRGYRAYVWPATAKWICRDTGKGGTIMRYDRGRFELLVSNGGFKEKRIRHNTQTTSNAAASVLVLGGARRQPAQY